MVRLRTKGHGVCFLFLLRHLSVQTKLESLFKPALLHSGTSPTRGTSIAGYTRPVYVPSAFPSVPVVNLLLSFMDTFYSSNPDYRLSLILLPYSARLERFSVLSSLWHIPARYVDSFQILSNLPVIPPWKQVTCGSQSGGPPACRSKGPEGGSVWRQHCLVRPPHSCLPLSLLTRNAPQPAHGAGTARPSVLVCFTSLHGKTLIIRSNLGSSGLVRHKVALKTKQQQKNSVALSPRANYTDWATATCGRNLVPTFVDRGVSRGQRGGSRTVVNLSFLDRSRYFSFK
jgi:hypothetical protein